MKFINYFQSYINQKEDSKILNEMIMCHNALLKASLSQIFSQNIYMVKKYRDSWNLKLKNINDISVADIFEEIKLSGKKGVMSLELTVSIKSVEDDLNLKGGKFNHLNMLMYVKSEVMKNGSEEDWLAELHSLKGYIFATQNDIVIRYFMDDLLKTFKEKADKNIFFQKIMKLLVVDESLAIHFIQHKKTMIPILDFALKNHNGHSRTLIEKTIKVLEKDPDYGSLVPKVSDRHILFQENNKIIKSEVWELDFQNMVRALKLNTKSDMHVLSYNSFLHSFVNVLNDCGVNIQVVQIFSGHKNKSPFKINVEIESLKNLSYAAIQDFLDYLVLKVGSGDSLLNDMRDKTMSTLKDRNMAVDKIIKIEWDYFILDYTIPEAKAEKGELKKQ